MAGEGSPFNSNSESDDTYKKWEVTDDDLEKDDDDDKEKPERKSIFDKTEKKGKEKKDKDGAAKSEGLLASLLGAEKDKDEEEEPPKNSFLNSTGDGVEEPLVETTPATPADVADKFEELVEDKIDAVDHKIVETSDPIQVGELLADAGLLENVVDKLEEGQDPVKAIENAADESLENPIPDADELDMVQAEAFEQAPQPTTEATPPPEETTPVAPTIAPPPPPPPLSPVPPIPPTPPLGSPGGPPLYNPNFNTPPPAAADTDPELVPMNDSFNRDPKTGKVIAAGVLGYALGRRGGRKRTEAKLEPVIEKQKDDLQDLGKKLEASEELVRKKAAAEASKAAALDAVSAKAAKQEGEINQPEELKVPERPTNIPAETIAEEKEEFIQREKEFEAEIDRIEHQKAEVAEELGKAPPVEAVSEPSEDLVTLLNEERIKETARVEEAVGQEQSFGARVETEDEKKREKQRAAAAMEQKAKEKTRLQEAKKHTDARTMTMPRVLEIAEFIPLKNSLNLRQMYEAQRIDSVNLRRVVNEYLSGRNYEKLLNQSFEAVEIRSELKHEIKQDNSIYKPPQQTATGVVDGLIQATSDTRIGQQQGAQSQPGNQQVLSDVPEQAEQIEDTGLVISNTTAIIVGILGGIFIMLLILFYSDLL